MNNREPPISENNFGGAMSRTNTIIPTHEPLNLGKSSHRSRFESMSEISKADDEDSEQADESLHRSKSVISASSATSNAKSLKMSHSKSSESSAFRSVKHSIDSRSPAFEKGFSANFNEIKKSSIPRYSSSVGFKTSKRSTGKKRNSKSSKRSNKDIKFYPHMSSVGGDTIQEKSDEEDAIESPSRVRKFEESKFPPSKSFDESEEPDEYEGSVGIQGRNASVEVSNDSSKISGINSRKDQQSNTIVSDCNEQTMVPTVDRDAISEKESENSDDMFMIESLT